MVAAAALSLFSSHPFIFFPLALVALVALIVKVREWSKVAPPLPNAFAGDFTSIW
jgi:hypothetical protein